MRCIFGLVAPDRGEVRWDGAPIDGGTRLRFGYMPEERGLYPPYGLVRLGGAVYSGSLLRTGARPRLRDVWRAVGKTSH